MAEHLVAAANADDAATAAHMRGYIAVPSLFTQIQQVTDRRLRARQHHQSRIGRQTLSSADEDQIDIRFGPQRIEIVEIGDA